MSKRYALFLIIVFASIALVYQPLAAKEDTAQIKLKKTAISKKYLYTYTVKEGDSLSTIIKNIPGVTEKDISNNYQLIRELNPDIPDLENLEVGQSIILPGKPSTGSEEKEVERMKEDFTSMIVHELRSPLDGIKKIVESIRKSKLKQLFSIKKSIIIQ